MKAQDISKLTLEELTTLIQEVVDQRINQLQNPVVSVDRQHLKDIFDSIDNHLWYPPTDVPSTLELLRQDRDR